MTGSEQLLINDWCQQYPSHSMGTLNFGPDGDLYVSGGDGASFNFADYGQGGGAVWSPTPKNPCGDPPGASARRSRRRRPRAAPSSLQSLRRPAGQPVLQRAILRSNRAPVSGSLVIRTSGVRMSTPGESSATASATLPLHLPSGTNEIWAGDVGYNTWGGDRPDPEPHGAATATNFGWPCVTREWASYRLSGGEPQPLHESLLGRHRDEPPYYTYNHGSTVVPVRRARPAVVDLGDGVLHFGGTTRLVHRRALLRRPLAQLHLGDEGGLERPAGHDEAGDLFVTRRRTRSTSDIGAATCGTSTTTAARSTGSSSTRRTTPVADSATPIRARAVRRRRLRIRTSTPATP